MQLFCNGNPLLATSAMHRRHRNPASPLSSKYMVTVICDASAMTYCLCIPRDMNHSISDNFNNNTFYVMFTYKLLKLSFLGYKPLGYQCHSIWKYSSVMQLRQLALIRKRSFNLPICFFTLFTNSRCLNRVLPFSIIDCVINPLFSNTTCFEQTKNHNFNALFDLLCLILKVYHNMKRQQS